MNDPTRESRKKNKKRKSTPKTTKATTLTTEERLTAYRDERQIERKRTDLAGIEAVNAKTARTMGYPPHDGFIIPYKHPLKDELLQTQRIRFFDPPSINGKQCRFFQLKGTPVEAYFDPNVTNWPKVFRDSKIDLYIVEGEMKAIAMNQHGFVTIALGGVNSFGGENLTPLLQKITWKGRRVFIMYDSDMATNENVQRAARQLAEVLS